MDLFALLFIVSFLVLILTLAVMYIRKHIKTKDNVAKGSKHIGWVSDVLGRSNETQEKWKETLPKHSTRIKLRNSHKLRNKRKGKI